MSDAQLPPPELVQVYTAEDEVISKAVTVHLGRPDRREVPVCGVNSIATTLRWSAVTCEACKNTSAYGTHSCSTTLQG